MIATVTMMTTMEKAPSQGHEGIVVIIIKGNYHHVDNDNDENTDNDHNGDNGDNEDTGGNGDNNGKGAKPPSRPMFPRVDFHARVQPPLYTGVLLIIMIIDTLIIMINATIIMIINTMIIMSIVTMVSIMRQQ